MFSYEYKKSNFVSYEELASLIGDSFREQMVLYYKYSSDNSYKFLEHIKSGILPIDNLSIEYIFYAINKHSNISGFNEKYISKIISMNNDVFIDKFIEFLKSYNFNDFNSRISSDYIRNFACILSYIDLNSNIIIEIKRFFNKIPNNTYSMDFITQFCYCSKGQVGFNRYKRYLIDKVISFDYSDCKYLRDIPKLMLDLELSADYVKAKDAIDLRKIIKNSRFSKISFGKIYVLRDALITNIDKFDNIHNTFILDYIDNRDFYINEDDVSFIKDYLEKKLNYGAKGCKYNGLLEKIKTYNSDEIKDLDLIKLKK